MINVAINGFGRIGRLVLKAGINNKNIRFVAVNDLTEPKTLAHLLKWDSVHGKFPGKVEAKNDSIVVNGKEIKITAEKDPSKLPWKKLKVDVVVESTGHFRTYDDCKLHIKAGAKKVVLSAPPKGDKPIKQIVMGVNDKTYKGEDIVSNASCTTNCFAPMAKVINDNYGIIDGVMTTIHSYTNDQEILDSPHKDLRRARSAALNIVPTSTGAAEAINEVIPELSGKLIGSSIRVPTPDGSLCHFVAEIKGMRNKCVTEEVNSLFKKMAATKYKGIIEYSEEPLVSTDVIGNPNSCLFDSKLTTCVGNNLIVVAWYDNEWGYSNRMIDVIKLVMK
ncbi:MAG: type I glyceraldehyde-3-phosphate dehydrogenase [Nanoarchaeota archaeon]|nr:type I glyceraldehyde-3-phosphate dehydrogenase [Nanoarchaeota archaeon]MBU1946624.1 type I glyceraldehyde-3-phosphate dehydrogenase [Nanoarchaeota archaeon]